MAGSVVGTKNQWPNYSAQNVQNASRNPVKELGKDQFLQILVTQLQNQDPMQPMQDKEFISQMAQFSSLEQMTNMSNGMSSLRQSAGMSAALIGKQVSWLETTKTGTVELNGTVKSVLWRDGVQYVKAGDKELKMDDIVSISEPTEKEDEVAPSE
jgi:flagellar basal-body rod modification protein FlgD